MDKKLTGEVAQEQIDAWKKKHGEVYAIKVDGHICYLKEPERKALNYAAAMGETNPLGVVETVLNSAWLAGSEAIKTNNKLFLGAAKLIDKLIEAKEAELVKL